MKRAGDSGSVGRKSTICPPACPPGCPLGCALVLTPVLTVALLTRFTYGGRRAGFYREGPNVSCIAGSLGIIVGQRHRMSINFGRLGVLARRARRRLGDGH